VHVRLNGRDPEFTVEPAEADLPAPAPSVDVPDDDGGGTWRVSLRLPETLRAGVEGAARREGVSVNAWLVRSAAAALGGAGRPSRGGDKNFSGWVR
jgi:hypothetical protein